jgi:hypothetical protein
LKITARTLVILLTTAASLSAQSQEIPARNFPRVEVPFGFSYLNAPLGPQSTIFAPTGHGYFGAHLGIKVNLNKNIGLLMDAVATDGASLLVPPSDHSFSLGRNQLLFGPELAFRKRRFNAFAHTLVGFASMDLSSEQANCIDVGPSLNSVCLNSDGSTTPGVVDLVRKRSLALSFGGGVDINWKRHWAVRPLQVDYMPARVDGNWVQGFGISTGLVLKF